MPKSDAPTAGFIRQFGGHRWLLVLVLVALVLAAVGWTAFGRGDSGPAADAEGRRGTETTTVPVPTPGPRTQGANAAELGITRDGDTFTLSGNVPDSISKSVLDSAVKAQWINANVVDQLNVVEGVSAPDLSAIGGVLSAADSIPDFSLSLSGDTLTLVGTAPTLEVASQVQEAASLAFPNTKLANNIQIPALGGPAPPPTGATPPSAAAAAGSNHCATLQSDITGTLRTPISFLTGGSELTADSRQELAQVAGKIEACPAVSVSVVGYTDNVGSAAANLSLSASRAKSVAALLVSDGVRIDHVTSRGAGSANPVASNDTPTGRAQNRRVEITTH